MSRYVARGGKIFGPFPDHAKISEYSWVWNSSSRVWEPIDPAPNSTS